MILRLDSAGGTGLPVTGPCGRSRAAAAAAAASKGPCSRAGAGARRRRRGAARCVWGKRLRQRPGPRPARVRFFESYRAARVRPASAAVPPSVGGAARSGGVVSAPCFVAPALWAALVWCILCPFWAAWGGHTMSFFPPWEQLIAPRRRVGRHHNVTPPDNRQT
eukprot:gene8001-biopygen10602